MASSRVRTSIILAAICLFIFVTLRSKVQPTPPPQHVQEALKAAASPPSVNIPSVPKVAEKVADVANSAKSVFSKIYENNMWGSNGGKLFSGPGSHDDNVVAPYVEAVRSWISEKFGSQAPDALDLGCGDFNVGRQIRNVTGKYTAGDVVPLVIKQLKEEYATEKVDFKVIDIIADDLPKADIVFIRQVLQHLSNDQIQQVLPKLKKYKWAIITEHLPGDDNFKPNVDIPTGRVRFEFGSATDLTAPPFSLQYLKKEVLVEVPSNGRIRTTAYQIS